MVAAARRGRMVGGVFVALCVVSLAASLARAEQVEIVTYYPSPAATTDDLKIKRASVGTTYKTLNFDDPLAPVADGTLLVAGNLSAGLVNSAPPPFVAAPNGQTTGNLTVNDLFLRSVNAWASEAVAGGVEPPKPYTVPVNLPPSIVQYYSGGSTVPGREFLDTGTFYTGGHVSYDVYDALQLWRFGVSRDQVRIVDAKRVVIHGNGTASDAQLAPIPPNLFLVAMGEGIIYLQRTPANQNDAGASETFRVTITW